MLWNPRVAHFCLSSKRATYMRWSAAGACSSALKPLCFDGCLECDFTWSSGLRGWLPGAGFYDPCKNMVGKLDLYLKLLYFFVFVQYWNFTVSKMLSVHIVYILWPALCFFKAAKNWVIIDKKCSSNNWNFLDLSLGLWPFLIIHFLIDYRPRGFGFIPALENRLLDYQILSK